MKTLLLAAASAGFFVMTGTAIADQQLAQKNACMSCHGVDRKIVGPAFKDVAKKYDGDSKAVADLMAKVKAGSKGVWGPIPMPPNPQLKDDDSKKIIEWILGLK